MQFWKNIKMDSEIRDLEGLQRAKGFKLMHLNVRSLVKKMDQLRVMFQDSNIDVITFSETWLKDSVNTVTVELDGYKILRQDRDFARVKKKRGGGLLTYIRTMHAAECEELTELSKNNGDIEAQWTAVHRPHCKNVIVCNVYRPPNGRLLKAIGYLDECLKSLDLSKVEVYILGDMNVNYKNKVSKEFKKLNFFVKSNGLSQVIGHTTRNNDKTQSLIDVILTNSIYVSKAGTLDHYISDHQPIFVVKKKGRDTRPSVEFSGRSYRNYEQSKMKEELRRINWDDFFRLENPDIAWDYILNKFLPILDKMCPTRVFKVKNYRPEWITSELLEQIKDRDYFYKKAKRTGQEDDWNIAKHLRNVTNSNIRQARKEFVLAELQENKDDYKKFWKTIRTVIPSNKGNTRQDILLTKKGKRLRKEEVAHHINDYFTNIGKVTNLPCTTNTLLSGPSGNEEDRWSLADFQELEVFKVVQGINVSKSSGLDNISSFVVKDVFKILLTQVTYLFNLSVRTTIYPKKWKEALVIPIPKSGNLSQVQNYRPISLLPIPGKLLEKLVHTQISNYLEDISFLVEEQHGFRKNHSTVHSVGQLTSYINYKMDRRLPVLAAFIDFRKAFDCVQHPILLEKLHATGLHSNVCTWFESYLTGRTQRVLANNVYSTSMDVTQGVPQGSVLGPLFYIVYANDISNVIENCNVAMYADDTVLYLATSDFNKTVDKLQVDIDALSVWCQSNGVRMNVDKTKLMLFGSQKRINKLPQFQIMVNDAPLKTVSNYKYLGMNLDSQLNYKKHVQTTVTKVANKLQQLRRMRYFLDVRAATLVYKNMILPMLEYGDIFLVGSLLEDRKKLQVLQNKELRCVLNKDRDTSTVELHEEAKLMKLKYRRERHLLNYMFDMAQNKANLKNTKRSGVKTRSSNKKLLKIRRPVTEKFKKSLAYRGPKKWNQLPEDLQNLVSKNQFSSNVKLLVEQKVKSQKVQGSGILEVSM